MERNNAVAKIEAACVYIEMDRREPADWPNVLDNKEKRKKTCASMRQ
jgi:hypothetical protein